MNDVGLSRLSVEEKRELLALLEESERRKRENKLKHYKPYPKQIAFHNLRARERMFMAANQVGKSVSAAMEVAIHVTGLYPEWWEGHRFNHAPVGWVSGVTGESTRDTMQRLLLGRPGEFGTGAIPKDAIVSITMARGISDAVDTVCIRHSSGAISRISFKSYERGRQKWQGETLDFVVFDEEPPEEIYTEGLTRTNATNGIVWIVFTPLNGMSVVVKRFMKDKLPDTAYIQATIDDAEHYTPEKRAQIIASYPDHERDARTKGIPVLGSGLVFSIQDERIKVPAFAIPAHWTRLIAVDFGWDHPTAAVKLAHDRDADKIYVTDEYRVSRETPLIHAAAIKAWGDYPVAWPHDGLQHDKGSGVPLADQYRGHGLKMLDKPASFEDGGNGVEAGLMMMTDRMRTGRLQVFDHLGMWFGEKAGYHRKNGIVVKEDDDLMSATRYGVMMIRHAQPDKRSRPYVPSSIGDTYAGY